MIAENPITEILAAPLAPDWTVEGLAEQLLSAIAGRHTDEVQEFVVQADSDRQSSRLLRPLLACLAAKSAESGGPVNLYGGHLSFKRTGPNGPVWILGQFENRPGSVRIALRRSNSPPETPEARPGPFFTSRPRAESSGPTPSTPADSRPG